MDETLTAQKARVLAEQMIHSYFTTQEIPLTKHHIDSFDQFLDRDMINIIKANNPILILKDQIPNTDQYRYRVEIFVGGLDGTQLFLGSPTLKLENGKILKLLYPNEARLRNATYALQVEANLIVRVSIKPSATDDPIVQDITFERFNLFQLPLMLKSRYCVLHAKPKEFLREAGECPNDGGGYFIVDGSEKVLITRQEAAFNTLYVTDQPRDLKVSHYATMSSLNPKTRVVKRVAFYWTRERTKKGVFGKPPQYLPSVMEVSIPFVRKPVNIFVLFRALGVQSDEDILRLIYPDLNSPEAVAAAELLIPSMAHAFPFTDTYSAIQYIKTLTKGFSEFHVLDVIHNNLFPHVEDLPGTRAAFLASCVRKILRVVMGVDSPTSRDDTRNQRLLTSGFLVQMLFQGVFKQWTSAVKRRIDEEYNYNKALYSGDKFMNIFSPGNVRTMFRAGFITEGLMRGFKGKWQVGGSKVGEEKSGVLQALSRLSYLDFMSHCRRAVLDFDTGMKLAGPRRLNTTQYGYFCTSETPSGGSIGITKNLSMFTSISTGADTDSLVKWLFSKGQILSCADCTPQLQAIMVPIYLNNGLLGYTAKPKELTSILRLFKRTACLPPYSSVGFNIPQRQVFIFTEEGRPLRPLWIVPLKTNRISKDWRLNVIGSLPSRQTAALTSTLFIDPLADKADATFQDYTTLLTPHQGSIEYVDPYEQNEILIANLPEHIVKETTHMEIHPSTILGLLGNMIPFPNHNQSPRNQLSASQSKQSLSMYATNWKNRFDNTANVMCYGEAPLVRTLYQDYIGAGEMSYGHNIVLAMGIYTGYNQEDGIVMNADSLARGLFRNITYRSYEAFEEDDERAKTRTRIGNPEQVHAWMDLNVALDYSKLDESGLVRVGEYVDETTVIVGRYMMMDTGKIKDASVTPQVWTRGRVESVVVTVNNAGLRLVKIRVVQDRSPELGDKFSNRHGQKGTLGMAFRAHDMPRTEDGIVPDMIMNPHAIPSRMTIGQLLEQLFGKAAAEVGAIANSTAWMNEGSPHEQIGAVLEKLGLEKTGNQILYNGQTGEMIEADIFIGNVYGMRLKHMTEDKWNARGEGRREQRTHQPTGGRGNQGGLKIGEMERDAIIGHGVTTFIQESMMKRSDGTSFWVCNGCGTIPIYNEKQRFFICSLCDGPIQYIGDSPSTLEPVPPPTRSGTTFSKIEMPYATKLFMQELEFFLNVSTRCLTTKEPTRLPGLDVIQGQVVQDTEGLGLPLPTRTFVDLAVPEVLEVPKTVTVEEALDALQEVSQKAEDLIKLKPLPVVEAPPPTQEDAPPGAILEGDQPQVELPQVQLQPPDQFAKPVQPEQIFTGGAGEGTLIIVDTSEEALKAGGLLGEEKRRPGRPLGGSLEAQQRMSRSPPRRRVSFADEPDGEDEKEYATYKTKLTVQKLE